MELEDDDTDTESDASDVDDVLDEDELWLDSEKQHSQYFIGICKHIRPDDFYLFLSSVSSQVFFRYPYETIRRYLTNYSVIYVQHPPIHILQLVVLENGMYSCIIKTHWIRLIQRRWRTILRERQAIWRKRCQQVSLKMLERTGMYPHGLRTMPGLCGMMRPLLIKGHQI